MIGQHNLQAPIKLKEILNQNDFFKPIPEDILLIIFSFLSPEILVNIIFLTNKKFLRIAQSNLFWMEKLERHFESHYLRMLRKYNNKFITTNLIDINWYDEFAVTYQNYYKKLSYPARKMFSLVKEGDHESCYDTEGHPIQISLRTLIETDRKNKTYLRIAQKLNHKQQALEIMNGSKNKELKYQKILDYIYQMQKEFFTEDTTGLGKFAINPFKHNSKDRTILSEAIECHQNLEEILFLLKKGSSLDEVYPFDKLSCPIHLAAFQGRLDLVEFIIESDPDKLNLADDMRQTPIMYAAQNGQLAVVDYLLSKKHLDKNAKTEDFYHSNNGKTALHLACAKGFTAVATRLLDAGYDATITCGYLNFLPLHFAVYAGKLDLVKILIEKHPDQLDTPDIYGQTPFLWASAKGHIEILEYIIKKGSINLNAMTHNVGHTYGDGKGALHYAAEKGHVEIVSMLLELGMDATIPTQYFRELPIHLAVNNHRFEVVKLLIERFPEMLNMSDCSNRTPFLLSASNGYLDILLYLLSKDKEKICLTTKTKTGKTALHLATVFGYEEIVKILLNAGASPFAICDTNKTLPIHLACKKGFLSSVKTHIEHEPKLLNETDFTGCTPLMIAVSEGHYEVMIYLLSKLKDGLNLNARTCNYKSDSLNGKTALQIAASHGKDKFVNILLDKGAFVDADILNFTILNEETQRAIKRRLDSSSYATLRKLSLFSTSQTSINIQSQNDAHELPNDDHEASASRENTLKTKPS